VLDRSQTLTTEQKNAERARQEEIIKAVQSGTDLSKYPAQVRLPWVKEFWTYDPLATIRKVRQPILILQGALDRHGDSAVNLRHQVADVAAREGKKIKEFGYIDTTEPKPLIRLACQAQALGAVSIVIPPWNGVFGKYMRSLKQTSEEGSE